MVTTKCLVAKFVWVVLGLLWLTPGQAQVYEITNSWTNTSKYTNGEDIVPGNDPTSLQYTEIRYSLATPEETVDPDNYEIQIVAVTGLGNEQQFTYQVPSPGLWCTEAYHILYNGTYSEGSGPACVLKESDGPPPEPPCCLVVVEPDLTAYAFSQSNDLFTLFPVGTVPAGTVCDSTQSVDDNNFDEALYLVPRNEVSWANSASSEWPIVFAKCSTGSGN